MDRLGRKLSYGRTQPESDPFTVPIRIDNRTARKLWLQATGLSGVAAGAPDVMAMIRDLGFLQIDTIRNVTRAHNHILWSRNRNYREGMLWPLLGKDRLLFEHFTHDASLIPMEFLAMWQRQFRRLGDKVARHDWYQSGMGREAIRAIRSRIEAEGPLSTHAFDTKVEGKREMWARPPHKKALDQMWYAGTLATAHRENFVKFYDLGERVFPADLRAEQISDAAALDRLHQSALDRLAFASPGEVQRFWAATDAGETRGWIGQQRDLVPVEVAAADGQVLAAFALPDTEARIANSPEPSGTMRILNPFDPAIRDRHRLSWLFGFDYRNEMFVPADKRIWGYYVYPLLERDRFVGRIEIRADRNKREMTVTGFWPEPGVAWAAPRGQKLAAELGRFARLAGLDAPGWAVPAPKGA